MNSSAYNALVLGDSTAFQTSTFSCLLLYFQSFFSLVSCKLPTFLLYLWNVGPNSDLSALALHKHEHASLDVNPWGKQNVIKIQ